MNKEKYIIVDWPEIQDFMEYPEYREECYVCNLIGKPEVEGWAIPEDFYNKVYDRNKNKHNT